MCYMLACIVTILTNVKLGCVSNLNIVQQCLSTFLATLVLEVFFPFICSNRDIEEFFMKELQAMKPCVRLCV